MEVSERLVGSPAFKAGPDRPEGFAGVRFRSSAVRGNSGLIALERWRRVPVGAPALSCSTSPWSSTGNMSPQSSKPIGTEPACATGWVRLLDLNPDTRSAGNVNVCSANLWWFARSGVHVVVVDAEVEIEPFRHGYSHGLFEPRHEIPEHSISVRYTTVSLDPILNLVVRVQYPDRANSIVHNGESVSVELVETNDLAFVSMPYGFAVLSIVDN